MTLERRGGIGGDPDLGGRGPGVCGLDGPGRQREKSGCCMKSTGTTVTLLVMIVLAYLWTSGKFNKVLGAIK